jgi:signal transduction histidine kinase
LAAALHGAAAEVEDDYAITVDEVVVGDAPLDEHLAAVAKAAREALINAAKHAGVASVSLYAEVDLAAVEVTCGTAARVSGPTTSPTTGTACAGPSRSG